MKAKQKNYKKSIFNFPERINLLASFLIILVYTFILAVILNVAIPKMDYRVQPDYPEGQYNEDINPFLFIRSTPTKNEESGEIEVNYWFYTYIKPISANKPTNVRYAYSALDQDGIMRYFNESSKNGVSIPINHHSIASNIKSTGFSKYYIKVIYDQVLNEEKDTKTLKISEEVLKLSKKELTEEVFRNEANEYVDLSFSVSDYNEQQYRGNLNVDSKNKEIDYHINLQSWLVTEDGKIYPFLGLYNYNFKDKYYPSSYPSTIYKYLHVEYIYAKLEYQDANGFQQIYYKEKLDNLIA
ncbi:MAG: hypothetical protein PHX62_01465 [Bacilli bacterium]|nr:hypothetical protein [Bacilli bacterium]